MFSLLLVATLTPALLPKQDIACYKDTLFNLTENANRYFGSHPSSRHIFMIISGLMMDISILGTFAYFLFRKTEHSWRYLLGMAMFYGTRIIIQ